MSLETSRRSPQITIVDLLADSEYKAFFSSAPKFNPHWDKPWRVWLQRQQDGSWSHVSFNSYVKAHNYVIRAVKRHELWDGALACAGKPTPRPLVVRGKKKVLNAAGKPVMERVRGEMVPVLVDRRVRMPMPEFHEWCPYCRRPTRWAYYPKGHRVMVARFGKGMMHDGGSELRCRICGVKRSFIERRYS